MEDGVCRGVVASVPRRRVGAPLQRAGGGARDRRLRPHLFLLRPSAHTCTGDGNAMVLRAGLAAAGHGVRPVPPDRHLRRRRADHRGRARRGRLSDQLRGRALHGALRAVAKDLASRDVVSRSMAMEIREGRGVGEHKDHICLHLDHIDPKILAERLPGITETAMTFAGVDLTRQPIPVVPTVHYNMGGIPTNYHGEVVTLEGRRSRRGRAGPVRGRRGGLRQRPRRQPAGLQQPDRPGRVRPRRGSPARRSGQARRASGATAQGCRRARARPARPFPPCRGRQPDRRDPRSRCSARCRPIARCSGPSARLAEGVAQDRRRSSSGWPTSASPTAA